MTDTITINNRYQLIKKLGQGGMGAVYKAYDRLEKQHVALKQVLLPEKDLDFGSKAGTNDTEKLRLSLVREFSILATLRHPHILSVLDFGFDEDKLPFYTMTLLEGATDAKTYGIHLSNSRRIVLMGQMLQALHYLHRRGVLHRDLKPDNVFVTHDEQVKVMDFGLAKLDKVQSTQSDTIAGTISYMAPELFQGASASVASDLFAVGVMVYETMVGQHPFEGKAISERILKIMTHTPDLSAIPAEFVPWLKTVLEKDPAKRFPTAYEAMVEFYKAFRREVPAEDRAIRESFLQSSTFVGREAEFKQLTDALDNISSENAFFLIGGESGVGKSRLLDEFRIQALVKGATVLRGQATEGGGLPFQLWRNMLRRLLLLVDVTDLQAGVLKDLVPDASELLGRDIPDAPELTGKAYQDRIILTIVDLLRQVQQPIVLLLEDLHWAVESLEPLKQILLVQDQLPTLMIVTNYRDDEAPKLPATLTGMTHLKLARLDETAVQTLTASILGERGARPELVQMIQKQSEGNTFFIIETVRALAEEQGSLEKVTTSELPQVVFTGSMRELMQRRLRKVDAQYHAMQTLAAVIGRELDLKLLNQRFDASRVQAWLTDASNAAVLAVQDNTWRFSHDKLRETILADLTEAEKPTLHRAAAEALEAAYPNESAYYEVLMEHWRAADEVERELHYLLPVVENLVELRAEHGRAELLIARGLTLLGSDDIRSAALLNWRSESQWRRGDYPAAQAAALQAHTLAERHGSQADIAASLNNLGMVASNQGEYAAARDYHEQSLALFRQIADLRGIAGSLNKLGNVASDLGEYAAARDYYEQSLALYRQMGDLRGIAGSLNNLGVVAGDVGDYAAARDYLEQSLALRRRIGDQFGIASSLNNLGHVASEQDNTAAARDYYEQSFALFRQMGNPMGIAFNLTGLAIVTLELGIRDLLPLLREGLTHSLEFKFVPLTLTLLSVAGRWAVQHQLRADAARLAGLVTAHPAANSDVRVQLDKLRAELEALLPTEELAALMAEGATLDLETTAREWLARLEAAQA